ncbi:glycosyltransferase family 2 protein [Escherichia albertii]|uniref:Predicted glycosyltransferase family 2 n=1 Tax=Escherichia albertii TaxID=208962 RepID=A0A5A4U8H8_ESCAL|nr:glycosyltransferase family 2 protein [Escherichia albertii]MCZ8641284.1 glycosyltransferase family 2 protein [Escherichia albertii]MCZ9211467.1 glycosyltransferase family 2 protein [Escherichia albertii]QSZ84895.1 glycosyltransferase family 2 protein [Escherichia albertii]QSZ89275.1 glycosyltransferase family 2 protein [Escherichia albertii]QSZ93662.1 glycosyltransferase family 2 protein [Escherichia albertii]
MLERVSVIMPVYNAGRYVAKAIDSVLAQTYNNVELIIINDGSTDNTLDIISVYKNDPRVIIVNMSCNSGVAIARNEGVKLATGRYIAFLDSDDVWRPEKLKRQVGVLSKSKYNCCHSSYERISECGEIISVVKSKAVVTYKDMLKRNEIGNLTGIYDSYAVGKVYQLNIGHEDYLMWLDILSKTDSIGIPSSLAYYRVRESSLSSNKIKAIIWHYNILKKKLGSRFICIFYYMSCYMFSSLKKNIFINNK